MSVECTPVDVPNAERTAITQMASDARSKDLQGLEYESTTIQKCVTHWESGPPEWTKSRSETISFYGVFAHRVREADYRERYAVTCRRHTDYRIDEIIKESSNCSEELERYMYHENYKNEIRIYASISVEDATTFLDHLFQYDWGVQNRTWMSEMIQQVEWVDRWIVRGKVTFQASYIYGGCGVMTFRAQANRSNGLEFGEVSENSSIC